MTSAVNLEDMNAFFGKAFPGRNVPRVTQVEKGKARVEWDAQESFLRPGGFISGPIQMSLADQAAYAAIFTQIGITPMALTSNLNINFLRPCQGDVLIAKAKVMKLGRTLAVMDVELHSDKSEKVSSHAVVTYALPAS